MNTKTPSAQHPRRPGHRGQRVHRRPTPTPSAGGGPATAPATGAGERAAAGSAAAPSTAAALSGTLTIWEAYGASGRREGRVRQDRRQRQGGQPRPDRERHRRPVQQPVHELRDPGRRRRRSRHVHRAERQPADRGPQRPARRRQRPRDTLKAAPYNTSDVAITASTRSTASCTRSPSR